MRIVDVPIETPLSVTDLGDVFVGEKDTELDDSSTEVPELRTTDTIIPASGALARLMVTLPLSGRQMV